MLPKPSTNLPKRFQRARWRRRGARVMLRAGSAELAALELEKVAMSEGKAWEQGGGGADGETARAYEVFVVFLQLGPKRTIAAAYNEVYRKHKEPSKKADGTVQKWATVNKWMDRARAWDNFTRAGALEKWEAARHETREELHAQLPAILDAALAVALGWDVPSWRRAVELGDAVGAMAARATKYKPRSNQQARMIVALLDRAGITATTRTEVALKADGGGEGLAALAALDILIKKIGKGEIDESHVDAKELSKYYLNALKVAQGD
jgi:hypothetical protein